MRVFLAASDQKKAFQDPRTLLTIAGFDPSSGAGATADLQTFAAHGFFGTACVTALTVQSTTGVRSVHPVDGQTLLASLTCLDDDLPAAGIKIGMLGNAENVSLVTQFLKTRSQSACPVVLDPVLRSSSGRELLHRNGIDLLLQDLLPLATWVTPNLEELGALIGRKTLAVEELERGAHDLQARFPGLNIVVTGGHLPQPDDLFLHGDGSMHWMRGSFIESAATHGTGCAFSSALLCELMSGASALEAASGAKAFVTQAIRSAVSRGAGHGPMNLLWPFIPQAG